MGSNGYNTLNYEKQGGSEWVVGGTLTFESGSNIAAAITSASTSGSTSVEPLVFATTMTGVGGVGGRAKFTLDTNVALGGWSNALKAQVTYGAAGKTTGLGSAFCAELALSAGTTSGTYAPLEAEITLGTGGKIGTNTSFIYGNVTDDSATFNTGGHLLELGDGVVDTSGGLYDQVSETAVTAQGRLRVWVGGKVWYIPLCDTSALT